MNRRAGEVVIDTWLFEERKKKPSRASDERQAAAGAQALRDLWHG